MGDISPTTTEGDSGGVPDRKDTVTLLSPRGKVDLSVYLSICVAKTLAELCSSVLQKINIKRPELEYLAEEISKRSVESVARF